LFKREVTSASRIHIAAAGPMLWRGCTTRERFELHALWRIGHAARRTGAR